MKSTERGTDTVTRIRRLVAQHLGLYPSTERLADAVETRLRHGPWTDMQSYCTFLTTRSSTDEFDELAALLCVGETYFFRNENHFRLLEREVLPQLVQEARSRRKLRLLSAGCSTGEEPYSLAILLRESFPQLSGWDVEITAVDMLASSLTKARRACYRPWSLRDTSRSLREKYFTEDADRYFLDESICRMVRFEQRNLVEDDTNFWQTDHFDLVFCRNTLMYFSPDAFDAMVERFERVIRPSGYLFLGHAESLRGTETSFEMCRSEEAFCYRLAGGADAHAFRGFPSVQANSSVPGIDLTEFPNADRPTWMRIITESAHRIENLGGVGSPSADPDVVDAPRASTKTDAEPSPSREASMSVALSQVEALIERERFDDALAMLDQCDGIAPGPQALLLRASLLTNQRDLEGAERACAQLLEVDPAHAGAHYLMALCREQAGDLEASCAHDRRAIELDPSFAMPHLHMGMVLRRDGQRREARRELAHAHQLLEREEARRIALYGGGFGRQMLLSLCKAEWSRVEGTDED